jgi:lipid II:glycine glycyltransferase (peptidoglycan interpeptide bridge formation enzyme)
MTRIHYSIAYIDLSQGREEIFKKISCRTDIRKAQKRGISVEVVEKMFLNDITRKKCEELLKNTLRRKLVPYSKKFDAILKSSSNVIFLAKKNENVVSFIVLNPNVQPLRNNEKTAYLSLSATDDKFKNDAPNYLLIWEAICYLIDKGYKYFNLGLLNYVETPDKMLEQTALFKKKWNIMEIRREENVSILKYTYYKFFKNITLFKRIVYFFQKFFVS